MGKKFKNISIGTIGFGDGLRVEPGNVIELDDKLVERKKVAIADMIATGKLITGSGTPKETEKPKAKTSDTKSDKGKATTPDTKSGKK